MAREPHGVDNNDRKNHDSKPDDDADGAKGAGNCCGDGQRHNDFQDAAAERLARVETPEDMFPAASSRAISTSGNGMAKVYGGMVPLNRF
jgi:hypothetical protein